MNKELQIDDLTRGINDDEPMFNETEVQKQDTAHPGDKCWQDFMAYLEAPADVDGKAGRLVCKLDRDLADFLTFVFAQVRDGNATVVLTSDHGTSPSYDATTEEPDRFNARQFEVIVNGFLNVRYGTGDWVVTYGDKCIWLNHNLIYERGLDLADVQNEVAIFAMQFRGVSHALSATAMRSSYFGSGYARRMQNSFYPRRSGDVILNLMPGWIEERDRCRSMSGSMYGYDTEVPLVFYGTGAGQQHVRRGAGRRAEIRTAPV